MCTIEKCLLSLLPLLGFEAEIFVPGPKRILSLGRGNRTQNLPDRVTLPAAVKKVAAIAALNFF